jgi:hypothetical protein
MEFLFIKEISKTLLLEVNGRAFEYRGLVKGLSIWLDFWKFVEKHMA